MVEIRKPDKKIFSWPVGATMHVLLTATDEELAKMFPGEAASGAVGGPKKVAGARRPAAIENARMAS